MPGYRLREFPLVVEPTVLSLELCSARTGSDEVAATARVFHRLPVEVVRAGAAVELPPWLAHYFGDATTIADCHTVLGYDSRGVLTVVLHRADDGPFVKDDIPEEVNGRVAVKPSVRLVFETQAQRNQFLEACRDVHHAPTRAIAALRVAALATTVRQIVCDVGVTDEN